MVPLLSVIMCTYNRKEYVPRAIDSVLSQKTNFPFEIIIGDDCSTDGTRDILVDYSKKSENIILNFQDRNQGVGGNWASTVKMARGKYLAMIDDDDYYCDENRLQEAVNFLEANKDYGIVYTNYYKVYHKTDKFEPSGKQFNESQDIVKSLLRGDCSMFFPTFIIRKELIDTYVNLDDYINFGFALQDWPTMLLICEHTKYHYIPSPSYAYNIMGESITRTKSYEKLYARFQKDKLMTKYLYKRLNRPDLIFDEKDFDMYTFDRLLSLAYRKWDYRSANRYSKSSYINRKQQMASNPFSFYLYCTLSLIKKS